MYDLSSLGKVIILMGLGFLVLGGLLVLLGKNPSTGGSLSWLGRLPGDIFIKRGNVTFYFPISTGIVISLVGSLLLYLIMRR